MENNEKIEQKLRKEILNKIEDASPFQEVREKYDLYRVYCFQAKEYDREKLEEIKKVVGDYLVEIQLNGYRDFAYEEVKNYDAFKRKNLEENIKNGK